MLERVFYIVIAFLALLGLYLQSGLPQGQFRRHMFVFYTNQSNALVAIYHLLLLFSGETLYKALTNATARFCVTLMIWVTHIIYHFVLLPHFRRNREKFDDDRSDFGNLCVHYIVPGLVLLEWALFADKSVTFMSCLVWLLIPTAYLAFCLLRANIVGPIGSGTARYPYAFMDLDLLGPKKWAGNMALTFCGFLGLAFVLYGAARSIEFMGC